MTEVEFNLLGDRWVEETAFRSDPGDSHPIALGLVAIGYEVVPYILRRIARNPVKAQVGWLSMLAHITKESIIPVDRRGDVGYMVDAWIRWGYDKFILT